MPRYFFDVDDGVHVRDDIGQDCPSPEAAQAQAIQIACAYAVRPETTKADGGACLVNVRDGAGSRVLTARLVFSVGAR